MGKNSPNGRVACLVNGLHVCELHFHCATCPLLVGLLQVVPEDLETKAGHMKGYLSQRNCLFEKPALPELL